ncbi:molybdopterin-synthase adenylyltransferase MoeB [Ascidiaceihabitans sp.]|uniref:HesA/MoeB/ThiF family protein n=1 Tax=Ascidiaceihabitans sp. TaxID=1872644 RepID=UPI003299B585
MVLVFGLAALLWGMGRIMGVPNTARWAMIGLLYIAVLSLHVVLDDGHPLRMATGESGAFWLILGGAGLLVYAYRWVLKTLRGQAQLKEGQHTPTPKPGTFTETELNRYARHIVLRELGGPGQKALKQAKVLVVGAGGLGAPVLQYLAAAGVGTIGVIDDDVVDNANLQRQVIHRDEDIGKPKVFSAEAAMIAQNPYVVVKPYNRRLSQDVAPELIAEYDLVIDGCDNFATRYLVNAVCVAAKVPLVSGALTQWEGQISVFDPANGAPCYQCIFPQAPSADLAPNCSVAGVVGPLPGVVGSMMAIEAVKLIAGTGAVLRGELLIYDALYGESRKIGVKPRSDCPVCGSSASM